MTLHEVATNFVNKYENEIKQQLKIQTFDKKVAIECAADFIGRESPRLANNVMLSMLMLFHLKKAWSKTLLVLCMKY